MPAYKRYDGPAYRMLRATGYPAGGAVLCREQILSAEYGLIRASRDIPEYDRRMDAARARELGEADATELRELLWLHRPGKVAFDHLPMSEARVFGGALYRAVIQRWQERGAFRDVPITYSSGGIGRQLGQLRAWLNEWSEP